MNNPNNEFVLPEKWCIAHYPETLKWIQENAEVNGNSIYQTSYYYYPSDINNNNRSYRVPNGYIEITFEQFKKYVLKESIMKEIIGYKLIKPEYEEAAKNIVGYSHSAKFSDWMLTSPLGSYSVALKEAGVLDLWFEPVYKEDKFKVGDKVIILNNKAGGAHPIGSLGSISGTGYHPNFEVRVKNNNWYYSGEGDMRLATPEEIKEYENNLLLDEAKKRYPVGTKYIPTSRIYRKYETSTGEFKWSRGRIENGVVGYGIYDNGEWAEIILNYPDITINGYKAEFHDNYVKFGCAEISKQLFIDIWKVMKVIYNIDGNKDLGFVTIGKGVFSKDQIKEIAEYYLNK